MAAIVASFIKFIRNLELHLRRVKKHPVGLIVRIVPSTNYAHRQSLFQSTWGSGPITFTFTLHVITAS